MCNTVSGWVLWLQKRNSFVFAAVMWIKNRRISGQWQRWRRGFAPQDYPVQSNVGMDVADRRDALASGVDARLEGARE